MMRQQCNLNHVVARAGFSLVELCVVLAIVFVLMLLAFPFIQSAREASRRVKCQDHFRRLSQSVQDFEALNGTRYQDGENGWGHVVFLLPQLEEKALFEAIDPVRVELTSVDEADVATTGRPIPVLRCASFSGSMVLVGGFGRGNAIGNNEIFTAPIPIDELPDGASYTIAFGETVSNHAWAKPGVGDDQSPNGTGVYGSLHAGGANFSFCDTSVRFIANVVDEKLFEELCSTNGSKIQEEF